MSKTQKKIDKAAPKKEKKVFKKKVKKKVLRKKPPPNSNRKRLWRKTIIFLIGGLILVGINKMVQSSKDKAAKFEITKQYGLIISSMDKLYFGCTVYWSGEGRGKSCTHDIWKEISGPRFNEIEVTILKGNKHEFTAQARHIKANKISQIDRKGDVYLNIDGCLAKVDFKDLTLENILALESKCRPKNPSNTKKDPQNPK